MDRSNNQQQKRNRTESREGTYKEGSSNASGECGDMRDDSAQYRYVRTILVCCPPVSNCQ